MELEYVRLEGQGDPGRERLVLRAKADLDTGKYAVFCCKNGNASNTVFGGSIPLVYWFPDKKVKANDWVVLYTKTGRLSEKRSDDGVTSYFFYWNEGRSIWSEDRAPVLVSTPDWKVAASAVQQA